MDVFEDVVLLIDVLYFDLLNKGVLLFIFEIVIWMLIRVFLKGFLLLCVFIFRVYDVVVFLLSMDWILRIFGDK